MRAAVVKFPSGEVVNIIVADAFSNAAPYGCLLVNLEDGSPVNIGWYWVEETGFYDPNPPPPPPPPDEDDRPQTEPTGGGVD